jgi:hypothetical protein
MISQRILRKQQYQCFAGADLTGAAKKCYSPPTEALLRLSVSRLLITEEPKEREKSIQSVKRRSVQRGTERAKKTQEAEKTEHVKFHNLLLLNEKIPDAPTATNVCGLRRPGKRNMVVAAVIQSAPIQSIDPFS